jgi:hypothetical protein
MANLVVFQKPLLNKYEPFVVTLVYYSLGAGFTLLLCAGWANWIAASALSFDGALLPWLALGYASVFGTLFTFNALSWAGRQLSPSAAAVYSTFQPVGTVALSFLFVPGSALSEGEALGAALVVSGLLLTLYGQRLEVGGTTLRRRGSEGGDPSRSDSVSVYTLLSSSQSGDGEERVDGNLNIEEEGGGRDYYQRLAEGKDGQISLNFSTDIDARKERRVGVTQELSAPTATLNALVSTSTLPAKINDEIFADDIHIMGAAGAAADNFSERLIFT